MNQNPLNLISTPGLHRELLTKLDITGVTVLQDGCFRSRFQQSPGYAVLPDGQLICSRTKKLLERDRLARSGKAGTKKKPTQEPGQVVVKAVKPRAKNQLNTKKIKHRTIALVNAQAKKEMYSFTVTFPPEVQEDMAYKLFNNWLTYCRKYVKLKNYLWVREYQQNGTVHYHMLVPHFFHVHNANKAMQQVLRTQIQNGQLKWHLKKAKRYQGVHLGKNKHTKKVTNFAQPRARRALLAYMLKYMNKGKVREGSPNHYAWHNSRAFTAMITSMALTRDEAQQLEIRSQLNFDTTFKNEWFTHIVWNNHSPPKFLMDHLQLVNREILTHLELGTRTPLLKKLQLGTSGQLCLN